MPYGLRVYDANGNISLDITDYIAKIVYTKTVSGTSSGSVYVPGVANKKAIALPTATANNQSGFTAICKLTNDGYLNWDPAYHLKLSSQNYCVIVELILVSEETLIYVLLLE